MGVYTYCCVCSVLGIQILCVVLCIFCVQMCTVLLPPGGNSIAVNKYIISKVAFRNFANACKATARSVASNAFHGKHN